MQTSSIHAETTGCITRCLRISRVILHTLLGLLLTMVALPFISCANKTNLIRWWCRRLLAILKLRVIALGQVPKRHDKLSRTMFVANHISWLDIHVLNSIMPVRFIAKSEISHWPIFGHLARASNTLFIDRDKRRDAKRTIDIAASSLSAGDNLCFFPEGTTTNGTHIKTFKSSLIQAAINAQATIYPVAIRYPLANGTANVDVAYADDTTLIESIRKVLVQKSFTVELYFLTPITSADYAANDRRTLTLTIEKLIRQRLAQLT